MLMPNLFRRCVPAATNFTGYLSCTLSKYLKEVHNIDSIEITLTSIVRQQEDNTIIQAYTDKESLPRSACY